MSSHHRKHLANYLASKKSGQQSSKSASSSNGKSPGKYSLPDELLLTIFSYHSAMDLISASQVCSRWNPVANDNFLWASVYETYGDNGEAKKGKDDTTNYKRQCLKSCVQMRNRQCQRLIKKINSFTGLPRDTEKALRAAGVNLQLSFVDRSDKERVLESRDVFVHQMSFTVRWYDLEMPALTSLKALNFYSVNPLFFTAEGKAVSNGQCAKVTLISESVKGPPPDLQKVSKKIKTILETLKNLEINWNTNMQSLQVSYNKQLHEIRQTRKKINTMLDEIEKTTIKELDAEMTTLKASLKTDLDNCSKLKTELRHLSDAIHDIVDKSKAELSFIASWKCQEKIRKSETYLSENAVQAGRLLTFQADMDIEQFISKLSGLGRIVLSYPDQVFTVQGKSEYNVKIPSDSSICEITAICVLSNDQILVADTNNFCVKLLDQHYQVIGHCDLNARPSDMCQITPSKVAVTVVKDKTYEIQTYKIQFVSVNGGRLVKGRKLQFEHLCCGIAHDQKDLYLATYTALNKYSMNGDLLNTLHEDTSGDYTVLKCAVSPTGDKIFVTNFSHHKVLTLARDGSVLCTFTDPDLKGPDSLHVTAQGQVLVCGALYHTILQLDGEGRKKLSTLATKRDGLSKHPESVCYNRSTASIIVGHVKTDTILVFKVQ